MSSQYIKCPACNKQELFVPFKIRPTLDYRSTLSDQIFYIAKCKSCGYVRQYPIADPDVYKNLGYHTQKNYDDHCRDRAEYIFNFLNIHYIISRYGSPFRILDIGSGAGGVGYYLKHKLAEYHRNVHVTGVTLHEEPKTYIKTFYLNADDVDDLNKLPKHKYDLIIMSHSLEHLLHPEVVLEHINTTLLNKNGLLYIEVPSLYTEGVRMHGTFIANHISYFTKTSLNNIVRTNTSLKLIKMHQSNYWGSIKSLYMKTRSQKKSRYIKERFVEIKYLLSQIKNAFNSFKVNNGIKVPESNE